MAKDIIYFCKNCGNEFSKWQGQCSFCKEWNSLEEAPKIKKNKKIPNKSTISITKTKAQPINEVENDVSIRINTGFNELNRVLGGGIVKGSVILLGGDPGIGKSTILMQICKNLTKSGKVLYVTGEESSSQVKMRAERLSSLDENIYLLAENDLDIIEENIKEINPGTIIVDSVQTVYRPILESSAGSVVQVRGVAETFAYISKNTNCTTILVGHVTKDGALAGPRVLEHLVDTVLYFEGDRYDQFRILRTVKNRFGSTNEIGVFEMTEKGFNEVENPSVLFIDNNTSTGCGITCTLEGTRPILVEIQALTAISSFANPRRTATGLDYNRIVMISAIIEKKAEINLQKHDIYMNVIGGLKLQDRGSDLCSALAIISSLQNKPLKKNLATIGELSLTGDIRTVSNIESRIKECVKLGFNKIIVPKSCEKILKDFKEKDVEIYYVKDINEAILNTFDGSEDEKTK